MRRFSMLFLCVASVASWTSFADDLAIAREALRDGEWQVARTHAAKVNSDTARLVILESLVGEGKWDEVGKKLAGWKNAAGDAYDYYRAVVKGDHAAAMDILKRAGSAEGLVEVKMFEAETLAREGKPDAAKGLWREVAATTNVSERVFATACMNLRDVELLRKAYASVKDASRRQLVGVCLGTVLLDQKETVDEGCRLVRAIVKESPDVGGAREAFLSMAHAEVGKGDWKSAAETYHEAIETWPDVAKRPDVQEGRGWVFFKLGRMEEALEAFRLMGELAKDDDKRAVALVKEGDILQEIGKESESMAAYRAVLEKYPKTKVAQDLKGIVEVREREAKGRELYRNFKFAEAIGAFEEVAKLDAAVRPRMEFFITLCLYGQGRDDDACARMRRLTNEKENPDEAIRMSATLWLAKFLFNRRDWKEARSLFVAYAKYAEGQSNGAKASEALLWAARAAFAENDFNQAVQLSAMVVAKQAAETGKVRPQALLVQGQALIELARFDEAVLVFDRVASSDDVSSEDRLRARMFKADALYAMGADNQSRYVAALEAYRAIQFGGGLSSSDQIVVSFKIARTLVKLKRIEEAVDQYYSQVVLAYLEGRRGNVHFTEEARAAFSRAAFWLADEHESRGRDWQAVNILTLVAESDVPAAVEANKRIGRIENKGKVL